MTVKLVWITPDAEKMISKIARVSNPSNEENYETAPKLLQYCLKNNHVSIFEQASASFEINTSRTITTQLLRHRTFVFQQFSQRYQQVTEEPIFTKVRVQDTKNRQNSIETDDEQLGVQWQQMQEQMWQLSKQHYELALQKGISKELSRNLLCEGLTPSRMYMTGNIRSWIHFLDVRWKGPGVQKECRDVAESIAQELKLHLPIIFEAKGW